MHVFLEDPVHETMLITKHQLASELPTFVAHKLAVKCLETKCRNHVNNCRCTAILTVASHLDLIAVR